MISIVAVAVMLSQPTVPTGWLTDWDQARSAARASGRPILANFTGSDWCPYCIKLDKQVFQTREFKSWASKNVVLLTVDFPRKTSLPAKLEKQNDMLSSEYGVSAFPTVLFLSADGDMLGTSGYLGEGGPTQWTDHARQQINYGKTIDRTGFPEAQSKDLRAANDLRGKKLSSLDFGTWLTDKPELKGKTILIEFWATWCGPCVQMIPKLNKWHKEFGDDLVIIGLSDEPAATVKAFMRRGRIDFPIATDESQKLIQEVGVESIPHALLVSPDGVVRWQGLPMDSNDPLTTSVIRQTIRASKAQ